MKLSVIPSEVINKVVSMPEAIEVVKGAFAQLSLKKAIVPQRVAIPVERSGGSLAIMEALLLDSEAMGVKMVSTFPKNIDFMLPTISAILVLFDTSTGFPIAILDAAKITALRTGAAVGVATDILSRKESDSVAVFGAGVQSRAIMEAIYHVRKIKKVWIYDVDAKRTARFIADLKNMNNRPESVIAVYSPEEAVENADIICTATTSKDPVFDGNYIKLGTHINSVGGFSKKMREIDDTTMRRIDLLAVDSIKACLLEAGDLIIALERGVINREKIHIELGELITGAKKGRENKKEITLFKSVGNAVQDVSVAVHIFNKASELGLGSSIEL